jgi:hypothetical protein
MLVSGPDPKEIAGDPRLWDRPAQDHSGIWPRNAATGLCLLAAAAATVSFTAQYQLIYATRQQATAAAMEARASG